LSPTPTHHLPPPLRRLLAVVCLAVEVLAAPDDSRFNWSSHPLLGLWPAAASWLNTLPATALLISLLALAVLLQGLQSLSRFANNVSVGYFAAECRARVTARIHSQVLRLSFPCASGTKVGDLTDDASQGPEAIRIQIEQSGWGKAGLASP
jgi:ATP-binding cassette subfamily B protein/subfamily B ATP-binding cassette protein MsbA